MAIPSTNKEFVTVEQKDSLWKIAKTYCCSSTASNAEIQKAVDKLASINNLVNPDLIYPGQRIYIVAQNTSGSTSTSSSSNKVTIKQFGVESEYGESLFITWSWDRHSNTEHYKVMWEYYTADKYWAVGSDTTTTYLYSTFNIPKEAKQIRVRVMPVSKTYKKNDKETTYFSGAWTSYKKHTVVWPPAVPSNFTADLDDQLKLTASVSNIEDDPDIVQFQIVKDDTTVCKEIKAKINTGYAAMSYTVVVGSTYKVRCRSLRDGVYSDWTNYSATFETIPNIPKGFTKCYPKTETSIYLQWDAVANTETYDIQYTTVKSNFEGSDGITEKTGIQGTSYEITSGITSGKEYFFRIRATNKQGSSDWSEISTSIVGSAPAAPTTWSSVGNSGNVVIAGESLKLYWVHNSRDGSSQTSANIQIFDKNDTMVVDVWVPNDRPETEKDKTSVYDVKMVDDHGNSIYSDGEILRWKVRTSGIDDSPGDWSDSKYVYIYEQPTLSVSIIDSEGNNYDKVVYYKVISSSGSYLLTTERINPIAGEPLLDNLNNQVYTTTGEQVFVATTNTGETVYYYMDGKIFDTLESLPLNISALAGPETQAPIGYHLSIIANESYETVDNMGNTKNVNAGETVYSNYYDITGVLSVSLSAGDLSLENNISYTLKCVVAMNSGLDAESSMDFIVSWEEVGYEPDAEISIDEDTYTAYIKPYCAKYSTTYYTVTSSYGRYYLTEEIIESVYGSPVDNQKTTTGEQVYLGTLPSGNTTYYTPIEKVEFVEDVILAVYRREFDGSFTELESNLDGAKRYTITDPHPSLDYARYRIVSTSKATGTVNYNDIPGYPINGKAIIIQWDETWSIFNTSEDYPQEDVILAQQPWAGSMLKLPYNIDVSDKHSADVALIEYIGRKHPVSYYGTQLGETSTWNVEIPKDDKETLYALRRLATWMGNVYVREPSGSGYWANISISFNQKHRAVTIPVAIDIARVEGGK